jgi:hypothetical protein
MSGKLTATPGEIGGALKAEGCSYREPARF